MQAFRQPGCKLPSSSSSGRAQQCPRVSSRRSREHTVLPASSSEAAGSSSSSSTHASTSSADAQGSTKPAAAKPAAQPSPAAAAASSSPPATDWEARRKQRVVNDLVDVSACRQRECSDVNAFACTTPPHCHNPAAPAAAASVLPACPLRPPSGWVQPSHEKPSSQVRGQGEGHWEPFGCVWTSYTSTGVRAFQQQQQQQHFEGPS